MTSHDSLDWGFQLNQQLEKNLLREYSTKPAFLAYLNSLIELLRSGGVSGIQQKIRDANDSNKFLSIVSEFETARFLVNKRKKIHLLEDGYWKGRSPDILVADNKHEVYIEVKRFTDDDVVGIIFDGLRELLPSLSKPYRVDIRLDDVLSIPALNGEARRNKEKLARQSFDEFKSKLASCDLSRLPVIIKTNHVRFSVVSTDSDTGYPGFSTSSVYTVPVQQLIEKLVFDICEKALKRNDWKANKPKSQYLVAVDCEQSDIDENDITHALYGKITKVGILHSNSAKILPPLQMPSVKITTEIQHAMDFGWRNFLYDKCIIPNAEKSKYLPDDKRGIYFTKKATKNLSGVLVKFRTGGFEFLPNPFADDVMNDASMADYLQ